MKRPALVLDEAFTGLEPATVDAIWRSLEARRLESTTLILTADAAVAARADRVVLLAGAADHHEPALAACIA